MRLVDQHHLAVAPVFGLHTITVARTARVPLQRVNFQAAEAAEGTCLAVADFAPAVVAAPPA